MKADASYFPSHPLYMRIRLASLAAVVSLAALACGGGGDTKGGNTGPVTPVPTTVIVTPPSASLEVGGTQTFAAEVRDQNGAAMAGQSISWSASSASVATVNSSGVVTAVGTGSTAINATAGSKVGSAIITVTQPAVASVTISGVTGSVTAGQTANLSALMKDKNGNTLTNRPVTWKSSNTIVATIDNAGVVSTFSAGSTTITATSETISATLTLNVVAPAGSVPPTVASITPATLTPGATATITGTNFGTSTALNGVFVNGIKATVTASTPTQLTVTVPTGVPCQATQAVDVAVVTVGGSATVKQTLRVATTRTLAAGSSFYATGASIACNELPTSGTYLISVFNAAKSFSSAVAVELKGIGGAASGNVASAAASKLVPQTIRPSMLSALSSGQSDAEREHLQRLEQQIQDMKQYRKSRVSRSVAGTGVPGASRLAVPVPTTVGANATIFYNYSGCGNSTTKPRITARVVYVGPKVIVLEDNAGVLAGKIDADLIGMAKDFEDVSYPILTTNFGDPLAFDGSTDKNGKMIMMFTPQVNSTASNLLGFVQPCDLLDPAVYGTSLAQSNVAEIFYARAVTDTTPGSTALNSRAGWKRQMPATLIHETKHIISFAERFQTPVLIDEYEETWVEEATAQLASEMYGRAIHGNSWKGDALYTGTLDCEVRPTNPSCNGAVFVMGNHFGFLNDFLVNFEQKSIVRESGDGSNDDDIYGSSWLFLRWITDAYGQSEPTFIKHMVLNYNIVGTDNMVESSGKSWAELLSQFTLMLAADNLAGVPPEYQEASWNLPKIFEGYNSDFPNSRPLTPFVPRNATFGTNFTMPAPTIRGGGAMVIKLAAGSGGPQLLDLHDSAGNPLPSGTNVGIAVLRIQ